MVPCDVLEVILRHLDFPSLLQARTVCRHWARIGEAESVIAAATANSKSIKMTRAELMRKFDLTHLEACSLPGGVPFITRRGYSCWLYGPQVIGSLLINGNREKRKREDDDAAVENDVSV